MRVFSRDEVRALDARAVEELGLASIVLMENAGRGAAEEILARLPRWTSRNAGVRTGPDAPLVGVLCGPGNNGGDGYVVARHLHNAGVDVVVFTTVPVEELAGDALANARVCARMGLAPAPLAGAAELAAARVRLARAAVVVDGLLGTGFRGVVRAGLEPVLALIAELRAVGARVVALDVPSGLDCESGAADPAAVRADLTVTFAAAKRGLVRPSARPFVGELVVRGIGTPRAWTEVGGEEVGDATGPPGGAERP